MKYDEYNIPGYFVKDSSLNKYLHYKRPGCRIKTLGNILNLLKDIITKEKLYDPRNASIVICDYDLECALNVKYIHLSEIKDLIIRLDQFKVRDFYNNTFSIMNHLRSIKKKKDIELLKHKNILHKNMKRLELLKKRRELLTNNESCSYSFSKINKRKLYRLTPYFHEALKYVKNNNNNVYTNDEIYNYISEYLLMRDNNNKRKYFIDQDEEQFNSLRQEIHCSIAIIKGDILSLAFNCDHFHRNQVNSLIKLNMIELN